MFSWATRTQKQHSEEALFQEEPSALQRHFDLYDARCRQLSNNHEEETAAKKGGLLPKLRRAFEAATTTHNGSFPVAATLEETAFEACESYSLADESESCTSFAIAESCSSYLSYNMSRVDEDEDELLDESVVSAEDTYTSEADSVFSDAFRDMVSFGNLQEENDKVRDDVWLLTRNMKEIEISDGSNSQISAPSSAKKLFSSLKRKFHNQSSTPFQEEEINFGDDCSQKSIVEKKQIFVENGVDRCDSNRSLFRSNRRGLWNNMDSQSSIPGPDKKKKKKGSRKKAKQKAGHPKKNRRYQDPLKQLSLTHEKMEQCQRPFSPSKAFGIMRNRKQHDEATTSRRGIFSYSKSFDDPKEPLVEPTRQANNMMMADDNSVNDENCPTIPTPTSMVLRETSMGTNMPQLLEENNDIEKHLSSTSLQQNDGIKQQSGVLSTSSLDISVKIKGNSNRKTTSKDISKFKFKSPKRDTPRVFWGDDKDENKNTVDQEEPRVLYTDEGEVHAIIHPRPADAQMSSSSESDSHDRQQRHRNDDVHSSNSGVLNHLFHSELSTLYEESSSLECSSGSPSSAGANSTIANSVTKRSAVTFDSSLLHRKLESSSFSSADDNMTKETATTAASTKSNGSRKLQPTRRKSPGTSVSTAGSNRSQGSFVDDCEVQMRWEYSLGKMNGYAGQWRQQMPLMNEEELSSDYVAEI